MSSQSNRYNELYSLIFSRTGLKVDESKYKVLERVINTRLAEDNITFHTYKHTLAQTAVTDSLWQELIQNITVGETYFSRNKGHFNALKSHIFPELIQKRTESGLKQLRIWSAGCSTGEEPYSIAIMLRDLIPNIETWSINILGTDINERSLEIARSGLYSANSFRSETPERVQSRWFKPEGNKKYRLDRTIRNMVRFAPLNLIDDDYPTHSNYTMNMDLILCRNVTIYFSQAETQEVINRFWETLITDGWLVVGHSEPSLDTYQKFTPRNFTNAVIYQKTQKPITEIKVKEKIAPPRPIKISSQPAKASLEKLRQYVQQKREEKANQELDKHEIWRQAKIVADKGQWEDALKLLSQIKKDTLLQSRAHYLSALVQMEIGDTNTAITSLRRAIYCDPDFIPAYCSLGDVYLTCGEHDEARRWWQRGQRTLAQSNLTYSPLDDDDPNIETLKQMLESRMSEN